MIQLGVNIDHIATIREARRTYEPDPVWAAVEAQLGGADGITVHLREDRRHIQDDDVRRLVHGVVVFYLVRLYVRRGLAPTTWGRAAPVEARTRARTKATRRSARVRSRKTKGD